MQNEVLTYKIQRKDPESVDLVDAVADLRTSVNDRLGSHTATNQEIAAALTTQMAANVIVTEIQKMRDPEFFCEEYHGQ